MDENPYQSSATPGPQPVAFAPQAPHPRTGKGIVQQVAVVSSLMIVQGVLLIIFAVGAAFMGFMYAYPETVLGADGAKEIEKAMQGGGQVMLTFVFIGWSLLTLAMAGLNFTAAYFNFSLRGHVLGITALLIGLGSMLTVYCSCTGIPLAIYGLIIYFNPAVAEAFAMRKTGMTKAQVLAEFTK